ncbi:hypothetical protein GLOIN_2v1488561 [Rhizophagus clarus]|uniref:Uncharacterized protein n=1 Tax=Rhizophagus clarus TaxID=94130 RepID=A0A8H3L8I6_9GLOM|nr:hypothetical protein GLOIN_2v1488561 [Rhizophagus clarus]
MNIEYQKFQLQWYDKYPKLRKYCLILWERREFWAVSFQNNIDEREPYKYSNYVERSFDSNIGICTYPKGIAGGPCKYQAAKAIKYQLIIYHHYL